MVKIYNPSYPQKNLRSGYSRFGIIILNTLMNILLLLSLTIIDYKSFDSWVLPAAIISIIQLSINIYAVSKLEGKYFSLPNIFLFFSYITHLGLLIIFGFNIEVDLPWNPFLTLTEDMFREASNYTMRCNALITFGMCIILYKKKNPMPKLKSAEEDNNLQLKLLRLIGTTLILIGVLPLLYLDISRITYYLNGDYLDTYKVNISGLVLTISRFTEIGIMMLLIGFKENKRKVYIIILLVVIYQLIIISTGNRGRPIMFLTTIAFIYYNFIKKIGAKQLLMSFFILYIGGFILTFIGQIRMLKLTLPTLLETLKVSFIEFTPFKILAEFGVTIISLGLSLKFFSEESGSQLGSNYLVSLLNIFPNFRGILDGVSQKSIFVYNLPNNAFLGGSYLGELYYAFEELSYILAVFIGIIIAWISTNITRSYVNKNYIILSIYLILVPNLLWWTRSYFVDIVREFVWAAVLIYILKIYFSEKLIKRKKGELLR